MKIKNSILSITFAVGIILFWGACTTSNKSGEQETAEEHSHDEGDEHASTEAMDMSMDESHEDGQENEHGDESMSSMHGDELAWAPSADDSDIFSNSFHFVIGSADDLEATVSGNSVTLNPSGNTAAFVFHNKLGNIGGEVSYMLHDFKGELKLIHHFKDAQNYEFVSVNGNQMKLGRVVNGEEDIFDEKSFDTGSSGWVQLRVSAAGRHFKGYIGDENITHGHGDELEPGYVGMMIDGTGSLMVKDLKVTALDEE